MRYLSKVMNRARSQRDKGSLILRNMKGSYDSDGVVSVRMVIDAPPGGLSSKTASRYSRLKFRCFKNDGERWVPNGSGDAVFGNEDGDSIGNGKTAYWLDLFTQQQMWGYCEVYNVHLAATDGTTRNYGNPNWSSNAMGMESGWMVPAWKD